MENKTKTQYKYVELSAKLFSMIYHLKSAKLLTQEEAHYAKGKFDFSQRKNVHFYQINTLIYPKIIFKF